MGTLSWILIGLLLGFGSPFLLLQLQRRRDMARATVVSGAMTRREAARPANPFAAVSVRPCGEQPCRVVLDTHHVRYLAVRAPPLPLPGCDRGKTCGCRYIRHADRRSPGDRRDAFARFGGLLPKPGRERRGDVERRRPRR
jgi:hypothetical protein